ncbi:MAG: ASCH domain-containing protein [Armatimonadota bacterium]
MSNSAPSSNSQKWTKALLSIKPEFAYAILNGKKRYEFRRKIFSQPVDVVLIYATMPIGKIIAEFDVLSVISDSPKELWRQTNEFAGIDEDRFFQYFDGYECGYAIEIGNVRTYVNTICPIETFGILPPQSFAYIKEEAYTSNMIAMSSP